MNYRLSGTHRGCYIGSTFCAALGYADDIALLSPSLTGINMLLDKCAEFASEYDVMFNSSKSKLLLFGVKVIPVITFMGGVISTVESDKHLGNPIGQNRKIMSINNAVTELDSKTNMIMSHFSHSDAGVRYKLFKTYCMPLYGCTLWNLTSSHMDRFYTAWRKCVRRVLGVPYTTHCKLLHHICQDTDITTQLFTRFVKFVKLTMRSQNQLSVLCIRLATHGSRSVLCQNISLVAQHFGISRYHIIHDNLHVLYPKSLPDVSVTDTASVIREILTGQVALFDHNDLMYLLHAL